MHLLKHIVSSIIKIGKEIKEGLLDTIKAAVLCYASQVYDNVGAFY